MDRPAPESRSLLTLDDLRFWKSERAVERQKRDAAIANIEQFDRKLKAAAVFLPADLRAEFFEEVETSEGDEHQTVKSAAAEKPKMSPKPPVFDGRKWLNEELAKFTQGATLEELHKLALETGNSKETVPTIRVLINRMTRRGGLRKRGEFFYHPAVFRRIEAGELEDRLGGIGKPTSDIREIIRTALRVTGDAPAKAVIAQLWKLPEAATIMQRNPQYPYAMLSRMAQMGELEKNGHLYRLPANDAGVVAEGSSGTQPSQISEDE